MQELKRFIKKTFQQPNNGLMKIIIINGMVFMALLLIKAILVVSGRRFYYNKLYQYLVLPSLWEDFLHKPWTLLTYGFTHEIFFPMLFNMLLLYAFGKVLTNFLGSKRLITLYTLGTLVGGSCFVLLYHIAPNFKGLYTTLAGATSGVYAVTVGTATFAPNFSFRLLFFGQIKIKYIVFVLLLLAMMEFSSNAPEKAIAQWGGVLLGYIYIQTNKKGIDYAKPFTYFLSFVKCHSKKLKIKKGIQRTNRNIGYQKKIDIILDKIAKSGYESLTTVEKEKLFKAGNEKP